MEKCPVFGELWQTATCMVPKAADCGKSVSLWIWHICVDSQAQALVSAEV